MPSGPRARPVRRAEIAQLVEHATENRGVASSILALGTNKPGARSSRAEVAQLVEHHLAKVRVAGSSPVFRSIFLPSLRPQPPLPLRLVVGQRTLDPFTEVRILEGQPASSPRLRGSPRVARCGRIRRLRGDVVKWLNTEVCKTSIQRFESARRLQPPESTAAIHPARRGRRSVCIPTSQIAGLAATIALAGVAEGQTRPT